MSFHKAIAEHELDPIVDHNEETAASPSNGRSSHTYPLLQHQSALGNRAVRRQVGQSQPIVQASLRLSRVNDRFEREAESLANELVLRPQRERPLRVRETGPTIGMPISPAVEAGIEQARGGGRPLDVALRTRMENAIGKDFSAVRIHTNARARALATHLNARAFTSGSDLFFGRHEFQPHTTEGQKILAHELVHSVQQSSNSSYVQRISQWIDGRYFSDAAPSIEITDQNAVISAVVTSDDSTGGHAIIYLERMRDGKPHTYMIDLGNNPHLYINIDFAHNVLINPVTMYEGSNLQRLRKLKARRGRSWEISSADADNAYAKARYIKDHIDEYRYTYTGAGPKIKTKPMNCARFAQKILKAAGVPEAEASAGVVFKVPKKLVQD